MSIGQQNKPEYRGRIAPTPSGRLHRGHAQTFWIASERCRQAGGQLVYRDEDLDQQHCPPELAAAAMEDLRWLGIRWEEGPDVGGAYGPYRQSERGAQYLRAWEQLRSSGLVYPDTHSRREIREEAEANALWEAASAPHEEDEAPEPLFPPEWRPPPGKLYEGPALGSCNWRFRVPDGQVIAFQDHCCGEQRYVAGEDFGDFVVWRRDGTPAYQLAVVVDDIAMQITEVVRGADLLKSTARQLLIYAALGARPPDFYHCPLVRDADGRRLAKRHDALSLATLREAGMSPQDILTLDKPSPSC